MAATAGNAEEAGAIAQRRKGTAKKGERVNNKKLGEVTKETRTLRTHLNGYYPTETSVMEYRSDYLGRMQLLFTLTVKKLLTATTGADR